MKKAVKWIFIIVLVLAAFLGAYVIYVFKAYYRLPDNLTLEVKRNGENSYFDEDFTLKSKGAYFIMKNNIGICAYRIENSFIKDAAKNSSAKDE